MLCFCCVAAQVYSFYRNFQSADSSFFTCEASGPLEKTSDEIFCTDVFCNVPNL